MIPVILLKIIFVPISKLDKVKTLINIYSKICLSLYFPLNEPFFQGHFTCVHANTNTCVCTNIHIYIFQQKAEKSLPLHSFNLFAFFFQIIFWGATHDVSWNIKMEKTKQSVKSMPRISLKYTNYHITR